MSSVALFRESRLWVATRDWSPVSDVGWFLFVSPLLRWALGSSAGRWFAWPAATVWPDEVTSDDDQTDDE